MDMIKASAFQKLANDPVEWLRAEYIRRRRKNTSYSLRSFAKNLGIPASRLSEVLSGKRLLTPGMGLTIADQLLLAPSDRELLLAGINSTRKNKNKESADKSPQRYYALSADVFSVVSDW